jgi:hypothetical protein
MADDFFGKFAAAVAAMGPEAVPVAAPAQDASSAEQPSGMPAWLVPVVIAVLAVAALVLFFR